MDRGRPASASNRRARHDPRHRLRPDQHPPRRQGHRASRRPVPRPHLHRCRAARAGRRAKSEKWWWRPTPSGSPPRKPVPRRSAPGIRRGVWWRDMGVVNLPGGRPTMQLTGGALARLEALTPPGLRGADRPQHHRRLAAGAGLRHNFGGQCGQTVTRRSRCRPAACAKLKIQRLINGLASFDAAVDCALKQRSKTPRIYQPERIRVCAGIGFQHSQSGAIFLTRNEQRFA